MKLLKWIFSLKSISKRYVNEILLLCYLIITTLIVVIASNCFELSKTINRIFGIIILLQWILLFIPCMSRILSIIDYNKDIKIKNGELKLNFSPILYSLQDILYWLEYASIPDTIYVKRKGNTGNLIIEVSYEVEKRNGPFVNKKVFIDNEEIQSFTEIQDILTKKCLIKENSLYVVATTEMNNPKLFSKIISEIKIK